MHTKRFSAPKIVIEDNSTYESSLCDHRKFQSYYELLNKVLSSSSDLFEFGSLERNISLINSNETIIHAIYVNY